MLLLNRGRAHVKRLTLAAEPLFAGSEHERCQQLPRVQCGMHTAMSSPRSALLRRSSSMATSPSSAQQIGQPKLPPNVIAPVRPRSMPAFVPAMLGVMPTPSSRGMLLPCPAGSGAFVCRADVHGRGRWLIPGTPWSDHTARDRCQDETSNKQQEGTFHGAPVADRADAGLPPHVPTISCGTPCRGR